MLWSEQLSCSLISHSTIVLRSWLLIIVKSTLLAPRQFRKVVLPLSSFLMYNCLLIRNSSKILPLAFVVESCHDADLELLSIVIRTPAPLACCNAASIFAKSASICCHMSKYMLAKIIFKLSIIVSKTTVSVSKSCFISRASIWLLVTTIAARFLPSPDVKILNFFGIPAILFWIVYGSWMQRMSVQSSSIIFIRLAVATLECCRSIYIHLICFCLLCFPVLCNVFILQLAAISVISVLPVLFQHCLQTGTIPVY